MARVFITGSSDGLGLLAAKLLIEGGHQVVLHARNKKRAEETTQKFNGNVKVLTADLSSIEETKHLANDMNALGSFDAVIHNAGVYQEPAPVIFRVNTLAPYILTSMISKPQRLIYISSNMHHQGRYDFRNLSAETGVDYSTSKLLVLMLALAAARRWPGNFVNAVDPGWVPTKMGGSGAPDNLLEGASTQVWLASGKDAAFSGRYLFHMKAAKYSAAADDLNAQELLLKRCEEISGITFPEGR